MDSFTPVRGWLHRSPYVPQEYLKLTTEQGTMEVRREREREKRRRRTSVGIGELVEPDLVGEPSSQRGRCL